MVDTTSFSFFSIRQIVDYALLNAFSVQSKGFSDGKAGLAVALFEVSRLLQDEYIEEQAFELLQEALLGISGELDFEHGEMGIGFVLLYLLQNGFLEADFEEIFGERLKRIVAVLEQAVARKSSMWHFLSSLFFLFQLDKYESRPGVKTLIYRIESDVENRLQQRVTCRKSQDTGLCLSETLRIFEQYLRWKVQNDQAKIDVELAGEYISLIRKKKIGPDYITGCYLSVLLRRLPQNGLSGTVDEICLQAAADLYAPGLTLTEQIRILYLMCRYPHSESRSIHCKYILLKKDLLKPDLRDLEKVLVSKIDPSRWMAGYGSGIARFLLFLVFEFERKCRKDVSRFQVLLG